MFGRAGPGQFGRNESETKQGGNSLPECAWLIDHERSLADLILQTHLHTAGPVGAMLLTFGSVSYEPVSLMLNKVLTSTFLLPPSRAEPALVVVNRGKPSMRE